MLAVSENAWLERLLLRAGPGARVVEPPESTEIGPAAARRLLARYRVAVTPPALVPRDPLARGRMTGVERHR